MVDGARQIGKSYIIRHVGQKMFANYIEIGEIPYARESIHLHSKRFAIGNYAEEYAVGAYRLAL